MEILPTGLPELLKPLGTNINLRKAKILETIFFRETGKKLTATLISAYWTFNEKYRKVTEKSIVKFLGSGAAGRFGLPLVFLSFS